MENPWKTRARGMRPGTIVGTAVCAAGIMVSGAGAATAASSAEGSGASTSASCGDAMGDKIGNKDVVVQSCPKGKQVVYTVKCGGGGGNQTKTASAYFSAAESRITVIKCGRGSDITSVDWDYA